MEEQLCEVLNCNKPAVRSLSLKKLSAIGLSFKSERRRVVICKEHYKIYKKKTKKEREIERLTWD
ncbi:MAG: hypothetical protein QME47_01005 [Candidatus Thermoplasmatota archaeon]|nr:hypothetical protein [Candidatus Thermoplasmatota archaeon]